MIKKEYIIGTYCPSCNHTFEEKDISGEQAICPFCGFNITLRSPLQRKKEKAVIKNQAEIFKMGIFIAYGGYFCMLLPLYLYLFFTNHSLTFFWETHPIGTVIYAIITAILALSFPFVCIIFMIIRRIKRHDYDIDWIRAFYSKHKQIGRICNRNYWETAIRNMDRS